MSRTLVEKERKFRLNRKRHGFFSYRQYIKLLLLNDALTEERVNLIGESYMRKVRPRQALTVLLQAKTPPLNLSEGIKKCYQYFNATLDDLKAVLLQGVNVSSPYDPDGCFENIDLGEATGHWLVWISKRTRPSFNLLDRFLPYISTIDDKFITKTLNNSRTISRIWISYYRKMKVDIWKIYCITERSLKKQDLRLYLMCEEICDDSLKFQGRVREIIINGGNLEVLKFALLHHILPHNDNTALICGLDSFRPRERLACFLESVDDDVTIDPKLVNLLNIIAPYTRYIGMWQHKIKTIEDAIGYLWRKTLGNIYGSGSGRKSITDKLLKIRDIEFRLILDRYIGY